MTVIPIYNPYAASRKRTMNGTSTVPPSGTENNQSHHSNSVYLLFTTMGIQSPNREGSIKKYHKTATKGKYKRRKFQQYLVTGGLAFYVA
jgi:hypothetical protein